MIKATQDRIDMMSDPAWLRKYPSGRIGEAGALTVKHYERLAQGKSVKHIKDRLRRYMEEYTGVNFKTKLFNIDIRHNINLTRNRRGFNRTMKVPDWGTMEEVLKYGTLGNYPK